MKSRNLFLGIIFLFIGVIALLAACDYIEFSWTRLRSMWPMLLILIGVMMLPIKDWLKAILLVLTLFGSILLYQ